MIRALAAVALAVGAVAAAGCGGSDAAPVILDTEKVERAIERSSREQRATTPRVSCPSGVHQKKGVVFECTAVVRGKTTRFVVTELDDDGRVHYEAP
jgi:hypothetical protein